MIAWNVVKRHKAFWCGLVTALSPANSFLLAQANPNPPPAAGAGAALNAGAAQAPALAQPPFAPLSPELEKYTRDILTYWQQATSKIDRFSCNFKRWQYDPAKTNADFHYTASTGILRYQSPDKGLYKVEHLASYTGKGADSAPQYKEFPNIFGEWWICDGKSVLEYDRNEKIVSQYELPPTMRGMQIVDSPLPFVFGVDAQKLQQRYWLRPVQPPPDATGKPREDLIVLEAYPKRMDDAINYSRVQIFLDRKQFLPSAIILFLPNWSPDFPAREHYEFTDRDTHASMADKFREMFAESFIPMQPPKDWKVVTRPFEPEAGAAGNGAPGALPGAGGVPGRVAQPPLAPQGTSR